MSRLIVLAVSGFLATGVTASPAFAQSAAGGISNCGPSGVGPNGRPCVALTPIDPNRVIDAPLDAEGADQYGRLDTSTLGQTYECESIEQAQQEGDTIVALIEDCGEPAQLAGFKPFYGTTGPTPIPASVPVPAAPLPAPVPPTVITPPPTVIAAPAVAAPPVFAPVAVLPAAGLGSTGLVLAGLGALGFAGIAALASGSNSSTSTTAN